MALPDLDDLIAEVDRTCDTAVVDSVTQPNWLELWLVILALDARSPLSIRIPLAGIVALSASLFWLCRGSISSGKARIAFHDALLSSEQQTQEWRLHD